MMWDEIGLEVHQYRLRRLATQRILRTGPTLIRLDGF